MQILLYPNKQLSEESKPIEEFDQALTNFAVELLTLCQANRGLGIAAPQVGRAICLVVVNTEFEKIGEKYPSILINPRIENASGTSRFKEGCLSVPGIFAWVTRPNQFDIVYQSIDGKEKTFHVENTQEELFGTVIQHEIDHLNGIEFLDRLNQFEKDKITRKLNKLRKKK